MDLVGMSALVIPLAGTGDSHALSDTITIFTKRIGESGAIRLLHDIVWSCCILPAFRVAFLTRERFL